jgi:hypothetical protein
MAKNKQPLLVMDLPTTPEPLVARGRLFTTNVINNAVTFASLDPIASILNTKLSNLEAGNIAIKRKLGTSADRNVIWSDTLDDLNNWGSQVMVLVRKLTSYNDQVALIQAFGGRIKVNGKFLKPPFAGVNTSPNVVNLTKTKVPGGTNEYQKSFDLGVTWVAIISTHLCKVPDSGYTKGSTVMFRTRATVGLVIGLWITIEVEITK